MCLVALNPALSKTSFICEDSFSLTVVISIAGYFGLPGLRETNTEPSVSTMPRRIYFAFLKSQAKVSGIETVTA